MKSAKKIASILIITSISMVMLAGCGSTTGTTTTNTTNSQTSQTRKFDPTTIKTLYANTLKALVTDGTITQTQSDKVFAAISTSIPQVTGTDRIKPTANKSSANKRSGTRPKNNQITTLVTNGVITQAQADKINANISQAMKINRSKQAN